MTMLPIFINLLGILNAEAASLKLKFINKEITHFTLTRPLKDLMKIRFKKDLAIQWHFSKLVKQIKKNLIHLIREKEHYLETWIYNQDNILFLQKLIMILNFKKILM